MADKMYRELRCRALENLRTHLKIGVDDNALDRVTAAMYRNAEKLERANDASGAVDILKRAIGMPLDECLQAINSALDISRQWGLASRASKLKQTNFRANVKAREGRMTAEEIADMIGDMVNAGNSYLLRRPDGTLIVRKTTSAVEHEDCELLGAYNIEADYRDIIEDVREAMA